MNNYRCLIGQAGNQSIQPFSNMEIQTTKEALIEEHREIQCQSMAVLDFQTLLQSHALLNLEMIQSPKLGHSVQHTSGSRGGPGARAPPDPQIWRPQYTI